MEYLEYTFENIGSDNLTELLVALLHEIGYSGFIEEENLLKAYISRQDANEDTLQKRLQNYSSAFEKLRYTCVLIPEQNWNSSWESDFQAIQVEDIVQIRASFHNKDASFLYDILIDPKMSFGTGHHETTQLMIRAMLPLNFTNKRIFDYGCGTAVLSILASKMGAEHVVGIDIDDWAYANALENLASNKCDNVKVLKGGVEIVINQEFDIILANINRNVILDSLQFLRGIIGSDGFLILSGIMVQDVNIIMKTATESGFIEQVMTRENKWICIVFKS